VIRTAYEDNSNEMERVHRTRTEMRENRAEQRRRARNTALVALGVLGLCAVVTGMIVLLTIGGGGPEVPGVLGLTFNEAKKKVEGAGMSIKIDPDQDSSGEFGKLKVENQDPKPGTEADRDEPVTVRLKGLHDSPELVQNSGSNPRPKPPATRPRQQATQPEQTVPPAQAAGRTVCLDPGHSNRTGNEIDPATGLNVGDNGGAAGELESNWQLALKTRSALEEAGYTVRLTKTDADQYVSLRERADIGNTCSIMVRLHFDDSGFAGVMRPPENGARCPQDDPSRVTVIDSGVAAESNRLATALAAALGLSLRDDTGGTSQGNGTPPGHPTALVGSVLSKVPVVCIENEVSRVSGNPDGQSQVAAQIVQGINAYFEGG
jgi:N-acetylmuramoyl-L-alanine amidase